MQQNEPLTYGCFYHICNHAVGNRDLFRDADNYEYFLSLYDQYISPIAETYAWVLMPNHFHLLVRIKSVEEYLHLTGFENLSGVKPLHQHFSNFFNAYTKAHNKYYQTHGTLFERPFKRKLIDSDEYLRQAILYIHNNPVHHGFCEHPVEYPWNSYLTCISIKPTKLHRDEVIEWFDGKANFKSMHNRKIDLDKMDDWLGVK